MNHYFSETKEEILERHILHYKQLFLFGYFHQMYKKFKWHFYFLKMGSSSVLAFRMVYLLSLYWYLVWNTSDNVCAH